MAIRYVYFDLGNVLLNFDHQVACRQVAILTGQSQLLVWQTIFESGLQERYEKGAISDDEFCRTFSHSTDTMVDRDAFLRAASGIFSPNVPVLPIVAALATAGYRLGILSNTCHAHWDWICQQRYAVTPKCFAHTVLSFEIGSMKPEAPIYDEAIRQAGVPAHEIFFVDDRSDNVQGARRQGIDAVLFSGADALIRDLDQRGVRLNL
jgi:putative hydrolase of the HAD superfamily